MEGGVTLRALRAGPLEAGPLEAGPLEAGPLEATFLPGAGMLGTSLRHRGDELLDLVGGLARWRAGKVTGLPLLAPWANRLSGWSYSVGDVAVDLRGLDLPVDEHGLPVHGVGRAGHVWDVVESGPSRLVAEWDAGGDPVVGRAFPFPHRLRVAVELSGEVVSAATTVVASGAVAVPVLFGWHPYLRLPGVARGDVVVGLPERRHLLLDGRGIPTGEVADAPAEEQPLGERTFDDLYELGSGARDRVLWIAGGGRRVAVEVGEGYRFAQVFAPPGEAHVCLEPMTAPTNALVDGGYETVPAGGSFTARFAVRVVAEGGDG